MNAILEGKKGKEPKFVSIRANFKKLEDLVFETRASIVALKKDQNYDEGHEDFLKAADDLTETANKLNLASMTFDLGIDKLEDEFIGR
jgi:hypothetical protein